MRTNTFLLFFSLTFIITTAQAQTPPRKCATGILQEKYFQNYPERAKRFNEFERKITNEAKSLRIAKTTGEGKIYRIPVVVHVIYNNLAKTKISYEQVASQIKVLNDDFRKLNSDTIKTPAQFKPYAADTKIEFCLASRDPDGNFTNGVVYTYNPRESFDPESPMDDVFLKSHSYWPSDQYLNIWVVKLIDGYLGYAQFPNGSGLSGLIPDEGEAATDGVVIDYQAFGTTGAATPPYNLGRTCTHEVGHWLGLKHIWGDQTCGDDFVDDTPMDEDPNNSSNCYDESNCMGGPIKLDMYNNYLDYSNDECMNMFTLGQTERMHAVMKNSPRRIALEYSPGCCGFGETKALPITADFETSHTANGWTTFNADSANILNETWVVNNYGGFGNSNYSLYINNKEIYKDTTTPYYDFFISPFLDLRSVERPVLEFNLAYAQNSTASNTDSLVISYNISCNDIWTPIATLTGTDLITTTRKESNFMPQNTDWASYRFVLSALARKNAVKIRLENYSKGVNTLYIDDISIYKSTPQLSVTIYPNPTDNELNAEILFIDERDITIQIYNLLGEKILETTDVKTTSFTKTLNSSQLSNGIYILRAINGDEIITKRFFIDRK